jgi:fumarate hydratase class II
MNPAKAKTLAIIAAQVMANDGAIGYSNANGYLEMSAYRLLIIHSISHSLTLLNSSYSSFRAFLVASRQANPERIENMPKTRACMA